MRHSLDVVYDKTAWECTSTLFETLDGSSHPEPLFDPPTLFLLPIAERMRRPGEAAPPEYLDNACGGSSIVCQSFMDSFNQSSPSFGVQTLNFYKNGTGGSAIQRKYYNIHIATLLARHPIAAIAYGTEVLLLTPKDPTAGDWTQRVETVLEVK